MAIRESTGHFADVNGVRLYYHEWPGDGPTAVCVHGLTANARCWDGVAERLTGYRVVAPDLRGRGLSDKPPAGNYGLDAHVSDVVALIQSLGDGPVTLIGHSMGAFIAAALAARHPELVDRLVLMDGGGWGAEMTEESVLAQLKSSLERLNVVFPSMDVYLGFWRQVPFIQPWNEYLETYLKGDVIQREDGTVAARALAAAIEEDLRANVGYNMHEILPKLTMPTIVMWGPVGLLDPAQPLFLESVVHEVVRMIPNSQLVSLEGTNHYTMIFAASSLDQIETALNIGA